METRKFGRTGHQSSVAILGGFAFSTAAQPDVDRMMENVIAAGVNHIDVAPSYGEAELRLGPWMARERQRFFLGCKTMERDYDGAAAELRRSLENLQTSYFDLYQIHAITSQAELDDATRSGGVIDAIRAARDEGLVRFIGITGHGYEAPALFLEALRRFDFDSVLFPINPKMFADLNYRKTTYDLLRLCQEREVGTMIIKSIAEGPWQNQHRTLNTWYQPFTDREHIQEGVNFVLSQKVTGLCTAGDLTVLPVQLAACQNYQPLSHEEQERLITEYASLKPIF